MTDAAEADAIDTATLMYEEYPMSATKQVQIVENAPITPMEMLNRAVESGANLDTIEKLMNLQERWEKNESRRAFDEAIAKAKAELPPVLRNRTGHNNKRYADFAAIARAADPILSRHGLSYRFRSETKDTVSVTCILSHRAGHSEENTLSGPADQSGNKNAIQAIGSTLTYLQRYSLMQALGLAATDDDDARASDNSAISEEQAEEIKALIVQVGADIGKFLTAFGISKVEEMPARRFEEAKVRLNRFGKGGK